MCSIDDTVEFIIVSRLQANIFYSKMAAVESKTMLASSLMDNIPKTSTTTPEMQKNHPAGNDEQRMAEPQAATDIASSSHLTETKTLSLLEQLLVKAEKYTQFLNVSFLYYFQPHSSVWC